MPTKRPAGNVRRRNVQQTMRDGLERASPPVAQLRTGAWLSRDQKSGSYHKQLAAATIKAVSVYQCPLI